jgi:hypothetical protein
MTTLYNDIDIIRPDIPRTLPVVLDDVEMLEIARAKAKKEQSIDKLRLELATVVKQKKAAIDDQVKLVSTMTEELATGKQLRQVLTDEIWKNGMVHTIRKDTWETVEKRPPTMMEQQRKLPATDAPTPSVDVELHGDDTDVANDDGDPTAGKRVKPSKAAKGAKRELTPEQREAKQKRDRERRAKAKKGSK